MDIIKPIRIKYLRTQNGQPYATVAACVVRTKEGEQTLFSASLCHRNDNFNKKRGTALALTRMCNMMMDRHYTKKDPLVYILKGNLERPLCENRFHFLPVNGKINLLAVRKSENPAYSDLITRIKDGQ
jgi:hypothetical protein